MGDDLRKGERPIPAKRDWALRNSVGEKGAGKTVFRLSITASL
jgi:hypothetical protein